MMMIMRRIIVIPAEMIVMTAESATMIASRISD